MTISDPAEVEREVVLRSQEVSDRYKLLERVVYRDLASTILLATERTGPFEGAGMQVVVKVLMKDKLDSEQEKKSAVSEVEIHSSMPPHPNIIRLLASEETPEAILLCTPFTPHGDLWAMMRYGQTYCEAQVRNCAAQMLSALCHLHHACGLIHADIKPHNFLLFRKQKKYCVQLCDFGLAERPDTGGMVTFYMVRGTSGWFSPEMLGHRNYSYQIDLFGVGLIIFRMLGGYPPFDPPSRFQDTVEFDDRCWCHVSELARHLISKLLALDPDDRGTAADAFQHEWIDGPEPPDPRPEQLEALAAYGPPPNFEVRFWPAGKIPEPHRCNSNEVVCNAAGSPKGEEEDDNCDFPDSESNSPLSPHTPF